MYNARESSIKSLTGPLNKNEWLASFNGLLSKNKLLHCTEYAYIRQGAHLANANANGRNNPLTAAQVNNLDDPLHANHAHTPQGIFPLVNVVDNSEFKLFPGNLEENKHAVLLLLSSVHTTFKTIINKNSCCIHTELHKVLNRCSTVSDHHVKALKKQWDNLTHEAHEDIPALFHKFHMILENIIPNPTVPAFAECITFANHKDKLIDSLHVDFANQKGCIKADEEHDTLDKLQTLLETITYEINFVPSHAIPHLTNLAVNKRVSPKKTNTVTRVKSYRYNPLQPAPHQPKPDYNCTTCNKCRYKWWWHANMKESLMGGKSEPWVQVTVYRSSSAAYPGSNLRFNYTSYVLEVWLSTVGIL
ncbi:hypothetical protein BJ741DRAFT_584202 [Chytriomyces cf. hyalinus JEL632]|nr:hypothetical protein BJ741DRAFT_584202 [Chytriomyces cf. hyalinus JEL632]